MLRHNVQVQIRAERAVTSSSLIAQMIKLATKSMLQTVSMGFLYAQLEWVAAKTICSRDAHWQQVATKLDQGRALSCWKSSDGRGTATTGHPRPVLMIIMVIIMVIMILSLWWWHYADNIMMMTLWGQPVGFLLWDPICRNCSLYPEATQCLCQR